MKNVTITYPRSVTISFVGKGYDDRKEYEKIAMKAKVIPSHRQIYRMGMAALEKQNQEKV